MNVTLIFNISINVWKQTTGYSFQTISKYKGITHFYKDYFMIRKYVKFQTYTVGSKIIRALEMICFKKFISNAFL